MEASDASEKLALAIRLAAVMAGERVGLGRAAARHAIPQRATSAEATASMTRTPQQHPLARSLCALASRETALIPWSRHAAA
jgi:hypothetical protein